MKYSATFPKRCDVSKIACPAGPAFVEPDIAAIRALRLSSLATPGHRAMDCSSVNAVEGWDPAGWHKLTAQLSRVLDWTQPPIPWSTDPQPFEGAPLPA